MTRGIDAALFSPERRTAPPLEASGTWTLGYVGRLSVEKNVAVLPRVARELARKGRSNLRFLIVGQGKEEAALRSALPHAEFLGVLRGEALAEAYSNMDCFLFPSRTDTFGNVVLEAMASGVPAVVTSSGGPAYIVRASAGGGCIAEETAFADAVLSLLNDPARHSVARTQAQAFAASANWDAVFEGVYAGYGQYLALP